MHYDAMTFSTKAEDKSPRGSFSMAGPQRHHRVWLQGKEGSQAFHFLNSAQNPTYFWEASR
jgi:hypothetical protein